MAVESEEGRRAEAATLTRPQHGVGPRKCGKSPRERVTLSAKPARGRRRPSAVALPEGGPVNAGFSA